MPQFTQEKSSNLTPVLIHAVQSGGSGKEGRSHSDERMDEGCPETDRGANRLGAEATPGGGLQTIGATRRAEGRTPQERTDALQRRIQLLEADREFYQRELAATQQVLLALDSANEELRDRLISLQAEAERYREQALSSQESAGRSMTLMSAAVDALKRREEDAN